MSETKKYLSGAEKRKKKNDIINYVSKLRKITTFFEMAGNLNESSDTSSIGTYIAYWHMFTKYKI